MFDHYFKLSDLAGLASSYYTYYIRKIFDTKILKKIFINMFF